MIAFGPIPSRRFGRSLGINNIPPHVCSFCCVYCQVGRTTRMSIERESFYPPEKIFQEVKARVEELHARKESVDYLSFVPDGEPTLDKNLGKTIDLLKNLKIKIAVVTNSTLLWDEAVCRDLEKVDWVSTKVDAATEDVWRKLNRPHGGIELRQVLDGIVGFKKNFKGRLTSETMLIQGMNDKPEPLRAIAEFLKHLKPEAIYLSIPTRPPAEIMVNPPHKDAINSAIKIFQNNGLKVETLFNEEVAGFGHTNHLLEDILGIASVHPLEEEALRNYLKESKGDWKVVEGLVHQGRLAELNYDGKKFYKSVL